jgi:hypothetical protein
MATTTNFGWETPDDTDLVKDGALAMRTLGNAIDASLVDLKGGTTGQVLSKTSNTDMDFTWVTSDDANAIQNAIVDAKGDLITATAADTPARLAVGSNGDTLVADSAATTGLRWQGNFAAGKNKVINGNMVVDQRNSASTPVTISVANTLYAVDQWGGVGQATDGVFTIGQDSSAPAGFTKSLKATITTADASIGASQSYFVAHNLEGLNVADLDFGSATAKTITLSFWVRSSLTGTFGGVFRNNDSSRTYVFSYSISVADTWEKKSITITGDTTGTWLKDTGVGARINFSLGAGSSLVNTAGSWYGASYRGASGQTQVIGTLNATWYVTGVQLEIGSVSTAFQTSSGTIQGEIALAQRYYYRNTPGSNYGWVGGMGWGQGTTIVDMPCQLPVTMRVTPTSIDTSNIAVNDGGTFYTGGTFAINTSGSGNQICNVRYTHGSAVFTAGKVYQFNNNNNSAGYLGFSAEL